MSYYENLSPVELVRIYMKSGFMKTSTLASLLGCTERDIINAMNDVTCNHIQIAAKLGFTE